MRYWFHRLAIVLALAFCVASFAEAKSPLVLITEIGSNLDSGNFELFELTNVSGGPLSISGWKVYIYDGASGNPFGASPFTLKGTTLNDLDTWVITEFNGNSTGTVPPSNTADTPNNNEWLGTDRDSANWGWGTSGAVVLENRNGEIQDVVIIGNIDPSNFSIPGDLSEHWDTSAAPPTAGFSAGNSWQRIGYFDRDSPGDWIRPGGQTLGMVNPGLDVRPSAFWQGDVSTDWSNASNWRNNIQPNGALRSVFFSGTSYSAILDAPAECAGLIVMAGANLNIASGNLEVRGNVIIEGTIQNSGRIELAGSTSQTILMNAQSIGSLHISNTSGTVELLEPWTNVQSGELTSVPGSTFVMSQELYDFSNTSGALEGEVIVERPGEILVLGDPGIGTGAAGFTLGRTFVRAPDPADIVTFLGVLGFRGLQLEGDGVIELGAPGGVSAHPVFAGALNVVGIEMPVLGDFVSDRAIDLVIEGSVLSGDGHFQHTNAGAIEVRGQFNVGQLTYRPAGAFNLSVWENIDVVGDCEIDGSGSVRCEFEITIGGNLDMRSGELRANRLALPFPSTVGGNLNVGGSTFASFTSGASGSVTIGGNADVRSNASLRAAGVTVGGDFNFQSDGELSIGAFGLSATNAAIAIAQPTTFQGTTQILELLLLDARADLRLDGNASATSIEIRGSSPVRTNNLTLSGDFFCRAGSTVEIQRLRCSSVAGAQRVEQDGLAGTLVELDRLEVAGGARVALSGNFDFGRTGVASDEEAIVVRPSSTLQLEPNSDLRFSGLSAQRVLIEGSLVCGAAENSSRPTLRAMNSTVGLEFVAGSFASITGVRMDTVGGIPYTNGSAAVVFRAGSNVSAFNDVEMVNVTNAVVALALETGALPGVFVGFDVFGLAPSRAVDARGLADFEVIVRKGELTLAGTRSDSLYRTEYDGGNVLIWEDPLPITINGAEALTTGQVLLAYSHDLSALGGNPAYRWNLAHAPEWLQIDELTGRLHGTPPVDAFGVAQFAITISDSSNPQLVESVAATLLVEDLVSIPLQVTTPKLDSAEAGENYGFAMTAAGGRPPYVWTLLSDARDLPEGMQFTPSGGLVGFVAPSARGSYQLRVRVRDTQNNTLDRTFSLQVVGVQDNLVDVGRGGAGSTSSCSVTTAEATRIPAMAGFLLLVGVLVWRRRQGFLE